MDISHKKKWRPVTLCLHCTINFNYFSQIDESTVEIHFSGHQGHLPSLSRSVHMQLNFRYRTNSTGMCVYIHIFSFSAYYLHLCLR
jgi:hypothetical protein